MLREREREGIMGGGGGGRENIVKTNIKHH